MSKIVIIGAGSIGGSVAEELAADHEVTVIDRNGELLNRLRERMDARFLTGSADSPELLRRAGCDEADIVLAVTESDLTNLAASRICQSLFDTDEISTRIIRIRNRALATDESLLEAFGVTIPYNPEEFIAASISGAVHHPGTSKMIECCSGAVRAALVDIDQSNAWVGKTLTDLYSRKPNLEFQVCAIRRGGRFVDDDPTVKLAAGDDLLLISRPADLFGAVRLLCSEEERTVRVFIAGGGHIGLALAAKLERDFSVTLVEPDSARCALLAQELASTLVLEADPTDGAALRAEDIEHSHYFCAVTATDEINIMSALLAKQLGCAHAAVLANRLSFQEVLRSNGMDMVVSPSEITSGILQRELQARSYTIIHQVGASAGTLVEIQVVKDAMLVDKEFKQIEWPDNVLPCALVKKFVGGKELSPVQLLRQRVLGSQEQLHPPLHFPNSDAVIEEGDTCLLYVRDSNLATLQTLADAPYPAF